MPEEVSSGEGWESTPDGVVTITSDGAVLDGLLIPGSVQNDRSGLRVLNSRIQCIGENDWCVTLGANSSITHSEIGGQADGMTYAHAVGLYSGGEHSGNVVDHVLIHHQVSGIRLDGGTTVTNSRIRDLPMGDPVMNFATGRTSTEDHSGGIMSTREGRVVLRGNRIEGGNTANVFVQHDVTDQGAPSIHTWLVENNSFVNVSKNGQVCSWGLRIEDPGVQGPFTVRGNTFNRGWQVGPIGGPDFLVLANNVFTDGTAIP